MRTYPDDEHDLKTLARLTPEPWMVEQLKLNPPYVFWGPHEDYMWKKEGGWDSPLTIPSWSEFHWNLDDMNEVVHFYFSIERPSEPCPACGGKCYHPDAQWISESFYSHSSPFKVQTRSESESRKLLESLGCSFEPGALSGFYPSAEVLARYGDGFAAFCERMRDRSHWDDDITEDEAAALVKEGRGSLDKLTTASDFNRAQYRGGLGGHDAINRCILIRQRCKRLGVPLYCETCDGQGDLFTGPARLDLTLWVLHPRKGCSRGVEIQNVRRDDLPNAYAFLRQAAGRNAERFSKIPHS